MKLNEIDIIGLVEICKLVEEVEKVVFLLKMVFGLVLMDLVGGVLMIGMIDVGMGNFGSLGYC